MANPAHNAPARRPFELGRREFFRITGAASLGLVAGFVPTGLVQAVPADGVSIIPPDKHLSPEWLDSLFARGERKVWRGDELKYIGMPVGGITCGQLYLAGDGRHNTLDSAWYGAIAWLSGLYQAALAAGEQLARIAGDRDFAATCARIRQRGQAKLERELFDGEYFINRVDRNHLDAINSGTGCLIDQALGQSWAFQVGLGRVISREKARRALGALWRYNFAPDIGPYRTRMQGRFGYAGPGEGGLVMCTFPHPDWTFG